MSGLVAAHGKFGAHGVAHAGEAVGDEKGGFAVARDILGLAPLYWVRTDDAVIFASEMSAFDVALRPLIEPFPPGHVWTPDEGLEAFREFPGTTPVLLQSRAPDEDPPEWVFDAVRESLIRAVERCMAGRQTVGVLLSGGVDSSIVTAIAARHAAAQGRTLTTFAVGLDGSGDLSAARSVAEHCGTHHRELIYTAEDAIEAAPQVVARLESFDPTLVHSAVPNFFVSRLAARVLWGLAQGVDLTVELHHDLVRELLGDRRHDLCDLRVLVERLLTQRHRALVLDEEVLVVLECQGVGERLGDRVDRELAVRVPGGVDVAVDGREADAERVRVRLTAGRVDEVRRALAQLSHVCQQLVEVLLDRGFHGLHRRACQHPR